MRITIIDHTDDWYMDVDATKLEKSDSASNPRFGIDYVYKLKVCDETIYRRVDDGNDYEIVMSPDGSHPIESTQAELSSAVRTSYSVYFNCFDVSNISRVLSAVTDQSKSN